MSEYTSLYQLPMLVSGQGQKDITHNEALLLIDLLLHVCVESTEVAAPPATPEPGQCWLVPVGAMGVWSGWVGALAAWTGGGWRYIVPREGMRAYVRDTAGDVQYRSGDWVKLPLAGVPTVSIAIAEGGINVDMEARQAIGAVIARMQELGLVG
ncbi:MAG: DUF2793 domain-containing protein [Sphingomonadaceae bacterium]